MSDCIIWVGSFYSNGYGRLFRDGQVLSAHRDAYEQANGPIPEGFHVHHRCENPSCVNPEHLEALSVSDHWRAHKRVPPDRQSKKTHCPAGHPYDEDNTYVHNRKRFCRACHRENLNARNQAARVYRELDCPTCAVTFTTSDSRKAYCSRRCKQRAWNQRSRAAA